jgi:hypothetical protein
MNDPIIDPERVAEDVARRLLERATALDNDGPTLAQLRQSALEAGISNAAFDAAVAEWRGNAPRRVVTEAPRRWTDRTLRNVAGFAVGWSALAVLAVAQRLVGAPWLVHKLTDPVGLAIGAFVAARLRARTATILLGGLAVSQGAELAMDLFPGSPAIRGFGAHMALMIAGVAGIAIGRAVWGRRVGSAVGSDDVRDNTGPASRNDSSESRSDGTTNGDARERFMNLLWLGYSSCLSRLQLSYRIGQPIERRRLERTPT